MPLDFSEATSHLFRDNSPIVPCNTDFIEIINRDAGLSISATSFVDQDVEADVTVTIELDEGLAYLGNGVVYDGFRTNKLNTCRIIYDGIWRLCTYANSWAGLGAVVLLPSIVCH